MSRKKNSGKDAAAEQSAERADGSPSPDSGANVGDEIAKAATAGGHVLRLKRMEELPCPISPEELAAASGRHIDILTEIDRVKGEKAEAAREFRDELADLNMDEKRLRAEVRSKSVNRMVECECVYNYDAGTVVTVRKDTGAEISRREMTDEERQVPMSFEEESKPAEVVYQEGPKLLAMPDTRPVDANNGERKPSLVVVVDDATVAQAVAVLKECKRASVSSLQRRMRVGYIAACDIMSALEQRGIVGPDNGSAPREILVDLDTFELPTAEEKPADEAGQ